MAHDFSRSSSAYLASIDVEIERLQRLREQVAAAVDPAEVIARPAKAVKPARKSMSAEGRRKIAEAQKARWAKQKKAAKKVPAKKTVSKRTAAKKAPAKTATTE